MIAGLVLAAGAGRRYGGAKQLARLAGRPLLEHALVAVAVLDEVVVVLGAEAEAVRAAVALGDARVVEAGDWAEGQAASLRAGVAAVPAADAVVIALGDQPGITRAAVDAVVAARDPARWDAIRATYAGAPGHPVLLERALLARMPALRGDVGARALLTGARVRELDLTGVADPRDVDTRADLAALAADEPRDVRADRAVPDIDDPVRMFLVLRRGAIAELARAAELAGAAAVACVRDPAFAAAVAAWRPRPGKVCLRARTEAQWKQVLESPHALAGDRDEEAVAALPPRRRSERGPLLERLQAMSTALAPPPPVGDPADARPAVTYLLNPAARMSSGKTVAQVAHAAVMAADTGALTAAPADTGALTAAAAGAHARGAGTPRAHALGAWVAAGCPGRVLAPEPAAYAAVAASGAPVARVVDAGLTEVPCGTVTVLALAPGPVTALPRALRAPGFPSP